MMRQNLIKAYNGLIQFAERWLPDKFYLQAGTTQRVDLRMELFREIIANLCVHSDYSTGFACFFHIFKDRVVTKNPTRLLPEIPEGNLTLQDLNNYTKNPLLVRVFYELSWVEDMGSGTRNILRYAPLYFPDYKVEINSGSQFIFSITYMNVSQESGENVTGNGKMSQELDNDLKEEDWEILLNKTDDSRKNGKKHKRHQGIVSLIQESKSGIPHLHAAVSRIDEEGNVNNDREMLNWEELLEESLFNFSVWQGIIAILSTPDYRLPTVVAEDLTMI